MTLDITPLTHVYGTAAFLCIVAAMCFYNRMDRKT